MASISISTDVNVDDFAEQFISENDQDEIMGLMMHMDRLVADYNFTQILIGKLQEALKLEDEATNGTD